MGIRIVKNPINQINNFTDGMLKKLHRAHDKSAQFMAKNIDISFENQGDRGAGSYKWDPTTRAAKQARKTYPKTTGKTGKKGLTKEQARYLWRTDDTLIDTGALRNSIAIEDELEERGLIKRTYSGAGKPYIRTHEEGGTITVKGKTYDVPERSSHFITDSEESEIENIFERALS